LMPFQESHCREIPSCESKPFVSIIAPSGPGTLYSFPSVSTPSTSINSSRTRAANSSTEVKFCSILHEESFIQAMLCRQQFPVDGGKLRTRPAGLAKARRNRGYIRNRAKPFQRQQRRAPAG